MRVHCYRTGAGKPNPTWEVVDCLKGGRQMQGSTLVRDPKFQDRVVAETRALLAAVPAALDLTGL